VADTTGAETTTPAVTKSTAGPEAGALAELRTITEEAYLFGFPMIVGYKMLNEFNADRNSGQLLLGGQGIHPVAGHAEAFDGEQQP